MKAVHSHSYGTHLNLNLVSIPKPVDIPKGKILIKTHAVALAPGDSRVLSGACKELQGPPSFPYIPGGDLSGVVADMGDIDSNSVGFDVGDRIAARFSEGPRGALAEYALIKPRMCNKVPQNVSSEDAAALASSATVALHLSRRIADDERVLVIGAGGGVGSYLCQLLRLKGVKYIAGVGKDVDRLLKDPLMYDNALDYTKRDIFDFKAWGMEAADKMPQFDTVIDLAGGGWVCLMDQSKNKKDLIVKNASEGGRYITTTPDEPLFEIHSIWQGLKLFLFSSLWRAVYSRLWNRKALPSYTYAMSLDNDVDILKEILALASENKLKACIDNRGPFAFTTDGVQDAFEVQGSRHAKGKVVIRVMQ